MNTTNEMVTEQLIALITQGNAHASFEQAVTGIPFDILGIKAEHVPYTIWQLVEHIRIAQWDILDFSTNPDYKPIAWPADYWPSEIAPESKDEWQQSLEQIKHDQDEFISVLTAPGADLYTPFPHGEGQNLLREALLIADHNSYHTGQIILLRRFLSNWGK